MMYVLFCCSLVTDPVNMENLAQLGMIFIGKIMTWSI